MLLRFWLYTLWVTSEDAEDAGSAANIQYDFIFEEFGVVDNGFHVGLGPDGIFEHFFMDWEMWVPIEIVIFIFDITDIVVMLLFSLHLIDPQKIIVYWYRYKNNESFYVSKR